MSKIEYDNFGQKLAFHTAPTLLGIKCASLVSLSSAEFDLDFHTRYFNSRAAAKGLKIRILCRCSDRALIFVYNEKLLKKCLADNAVRSVLAENGYVSFSVEQCLERLSIRIAEGESFPHEIGVFLGYPVEDVVGFIENKGENFKLCGTWKVYGNVENAKRIFSNHVKCRAYLCNKLNEGKDIYQALKIS